MYSNITRSICILLICLFPVTTHAQESGKKAKKETKTPAERIESLLEILKNDRKEDRRVQAAEELGKLASNDYPEIVAGLMDSLVRDESTSVRKTVIKSLAGIKPESYEIKDALDQAVKSDKSWSVRQVARLSVFRYKPKDEPNYVPGPKLRNTSKPSQSGEVASQKSSTSMSTKPADPLKTLSIPERSVTDASMPIFPPAPVMASAPGTMNPALNSAKSTVEIPARLTAPKPESK